jgi:peptidyl-prolyl cis-trans isomerase D
MFDFVHQKKRIVQIILALAALPFLFWGIESYRSGGEGGDYLALAAGEKIQRQEFDQALRNQQEGMRATMGERFNDSMLENPEVKAAVLEGLIQQRLLKHEAARVGLAVSDLQLIEMIQNISAFQEDGKFSKQRYEELLRAQGMSPRIFEARVRQELMRQELVAPYTEHGFVPDSVALSVMRLSDEKREVSLARVSPEQFLARSKPDDSAIKAYYDSHQAELQLPEQVKVEYAVLSQDELAKQIRVSEEEVRKYFDEHKSEFGGTEERRASHILISAPSSASDEEKSAARARAERLLAQARQAPQGFGEIAKQNSQDSGSAVQGGDLGFFARNSLVKPFEDVVFQMKMDEISDVVETDYGFHIIKLTGVKEAKPTDFSEVKHRIEEELKNEKSAKSFADMAESFSNMVYEQSDSLQPAAAKFNLPIQLSDWLTRNDTASPYFSNARLIQAIFSEEAIKNKQNTEAVEVSPNTLVSARVIDYRPASVPSLATVQEKISGILARKAAEEAASKEGKEKLSQLQAGKTGAVTWEGADQISRIEPKGLDPEILRAVFKVEIASLPAYAGVVNNRGEYTLIRVSRVFEPALPGPEQRKTFARQLQQVLSQEELSAYLGGIRKRYDVSVTSGALDRK